jgi:predicted permease
VTHWVLRQLRRLPVGAVARRAFEESLADHCYEQRGGVAAAGRVIVRTVSAMRMPGNPLRNVGGDIRESGRRLWRSPGFTIGASLILAFGIGINTSIFSIFNGVMLRALPVPNLSNVVAIARSPRGTVQDFYIDESEARVFSANHDVFEDVFTSDPLIGALIGGGRSAVVSGELVSGGYFSGFGLRPAAGRLLGQGDDAPSGVIPIVITSTLWRDWYHGDPGAVGATLHMAGQSLALVGVVEPGFHGTWLPTMMQGDFFVPRWAADVLRTVQGSRHFTTHRTFARLAQGVSFATADAAIRTIGAGLPASSAESDDRPAFMALPAERAMLFDDFTRPGRFVGIAVVGLSAVVFLIACANLANLLLARGDARVPEIAVRIATGASRFQVMRLVFVETALLTLVAAVTSGILTIAMTRALAAVDLPALQGISFGVDLSPDPSVAIYGLVIALISALAIGSVPAWRASRTQAVHSLKRGGSGTSTVRRSRLMTALVGGQIAMSLSLLVCAGLSAKGAVAMASIDPGFDIAHAAMASVDLTMFRIDDERGRRFFARTLETVQAIPGVESAVIATSLPSRIAGARFNSSMFVLAEGESPRPSPYGPAGHFSGVVASSPGLLQTLGMRLIAGRDIADRDDRAAPLVAVVNDTLARQLWPGQSPIGRRFSMRKAGPLMEVVGVIADASPSAVSPLIPWLVVPFAQNYDPSATVVVRAAPGVLPRALVEPLDQGLRGIDPSVVFFDVRTIADTLAIRSLPSRAAAFALGSLGAIALLIAALGLFAVIAHVTGRRLREFGIRKALGATDGQLYAAVLGDVKWLVLPGIAVGLALSSFGAAYLRVLPLGVGPRDPWTFVMVTIALIVVGLASCAIPARRAARVDPNVALRDL